MIKSGIKSGITNRPAQQRPVGEGPSQKLLDVFNHLKAKQQTSEAGSEKLGQQLIQQRPVGEGPSQKLLDVFNHLKAQQQTSEAGSEKLDQLLAQQRPVPKRPSIGRPLPQLEPKPEGFEKIVAALTEVVESGLKKRT